MPELLGRMVEMNGLRSLGRRSLQTKADINLFWLAVVCHNLLTKLLIHASPSVLT